jgi:RNA polymerase sigma factor (sigma-70 family)
VRLHRHWHKVSSYDDIGAWLTRVLSNLIIDHQRARTSERRALQRLASRQSAASEDPGATGDWADLIAVLPTRQRLIVTLHYGEDLSIAEIAAHLGIAPNTVKSGLSKARGTLRSREQRGN